MIEAGKEHKFNHITFTILEVIPYISGRRRRELLIGYKIKIGDWESPVAHFWMSRNSNINRKIVEVLIHSYKISPELRERMGEELYNKLQEMLEEEEEKRKPK